MPTCTVCKRKVKARDLYYRLPAVCEACVEAEEQQLAASIKGYVEHPLADHPVAVYKRLPSWLDPEQEK